MERHVDAMGGRPSMDHCTLADRFVLQLMTLLAGGSWMQYTGDSPWFSTLAC